MSQSPLLINSAEAISLADPKRKPYQTPRVTDHGSVNELTKTSNPVTYLEPSDGGTFPTAYTSGT